VNMVVKSEVVTAVTLKSTVLWNLTPYSLVGGETYNLHLPNR
jgi:hypothetical protein